MLGVQHPVMLAGMGGVSYSRLCAAVSEAGGFGCLGASTMDRLIHVSPRMTNIGDVLLKFRRIARDIDEDNVAPHRMADHIQTEFVATN